ncbi:hypothetical protein B0J14DRAFT_563268 [Halenospora varia]|nr:hypothetical protein B0J14DRAFT_563268 [Halenospora varia]
MPESKRHQSAKGKKSSRGGGKRTPNSDELKHVQPGDQSRVYYGGGDDGLGESMSGLHVTQPEPSFVHSTATDYSSRDRSGGRGHELYPPSESRGHYEQPSPYTPSPYPPIAYGPRDSGSEYPTQSTGYSSQQLSAESSYPGLADRSSSGTGGPPPVDHYAPPGRLPTYPGFPPIGFQPSSGVYDQSSSAYASSSQTLAPNSQLQASGSELPRGSRPFVGGRWRYTRKRKAEHTLECCRKLGINDGSFNAENNIKLIQEKINKEGYVADPEITLKWGKWVPFGRFSVDRFREGTVDDIPDPKRDGVWEYTGEETQEELRELIYELGDSKVKPINNIAGSKAILQKYINSSLHRMHTQFAKDEGRIVGGQANPSTQNPPSGPYHPRGGYISGQPLHSGSQYQHSGESPSGPPSHPDSQYQHSGGYPSTLPSHPGSQYQTQRMGAPTGILWVYSGSKEPDDIEARFNDLGIPYTAHSRSKFHIEAIETFIEEDANHNDPKIAKFIFDYGNWYNASDFVWRPSKYDKTEPKLLGKMGLGI